MRFMTALLILTPLAVAQPQRELRGKLVKGEGNSKTAAPYVEVILEETGARRVSSSDGYFSLPLPAFLHAGVEATLRADVPGFAIYLPSAGKQRVPPDAELATTRIEIQLLPTNSPRFYTSERLAAMVAHEASNSTASSKPRQASTTNSNEKLVEEIARQNGLILGLLQKAMARWSAEVESTASKAGSLDPALAAYANQDFDEAKKRAGAAAQALAASASAGRGPAHPQLARALELEGDSAYRESSFEEASNAYREMLKRVSPESDPIQWALVNLKLGNSDLQLGFRREEDRTGHLEAAVGSYRSALKVYTEEGSPQLWAGSQYNLAVALYELAYSVEPESAMRALSDAVTASNEALRVYTKDGEREGWGRVQRNLGRQLVRLALFARGDQALDLLSRAVNAYESALEVFLRDVDPREWALLQKDLGFALMQQMSIVSVDEALPFAVRSEKASRAALEVLRMENAVQDWGAANFNLANALVRQAESAPRDTARQMVQEAISRYEASLKVRTPESAPRDWGDTQYNLAVALQSLAGWSEDADAFRLLADAVNATERALEVFRQDNNPPRWALTQYSLGNLLRDQAGHATGQELRELLQRSVAAYQRALTVYTPAVSSQYNTLFRERLEETQKRLAAVQ